MDVLHKTINGDNMIDYSYKAYEKRRNGRYVRSMEFVNSCLQLALSVAGVISMLYLIKMFVC